MTTAEQIDDFSRFAKQLVEAEGQDLPLEAIFDRWREEAYRSDDLARLRAAVQDFDQGDRGLPAQEVITEFRSERRAI